MKGAGYKKMSSTLYKVQSLQTFKLKATQNQIYQTTAPFVMNPYSYFSLLPSQKSWCQWADEGEIMIQPFCNAEIIWKIFRGLSNIWIIQDFIGYHLCLLHFNVCPPSMFVSPLGFLMGFKLDSYTFKNKVSLLNEVIEISSPSSPPTLELAPFQTLVRTNHCQPLQSIQT